MFQEAGCLHQGAQGVLPEEGVIIYPDVEVRMLKGGGIPGESHSLVPVETSVAAYHRCLGKGLPDGVRSAVAAPVIYHIYLKIIGSLALHRINLTVADIEAFQCFLTTVEDGEKYGHFHPHRL